MRQQAMVIGLGQFGMAVAQALSARQVEVLAVDIDEERVRAASLFATEAACLDATDELSLAKLSPERRDVCLCAIGDGAREASIICTALLKQLGARRVIARSNNELHARILTLVGAGQVTNPEREFGERFANRMLHQGIKAEMPLGEGLLITEVAAPASFEGKSLEDLGLPTRYGVTVVAVRKATTGNVLLPSADTVVHAEDVLVVVAQERAVGAMIESC